MGIKMNSLEKKTLKPVDREEILKETLKYFEGDQIARDQWIRKYALKDKEGNIYESNPKEMHERLANEIYRIENMYEEKSESGRSLSYDQIYGLLENFNKVILGGSNMSGIGNNLQYGSLSNCFVLGNNADSYGGIMSLDEEQAQLMKRRGGVGHDLSHIRPSGSGVNNTALTSTGVVPFMERYSNTTKEVAQDGRRGALMLTIDIKHPDAEQFIDAKTESGKVTGANISVKLNDEFMEAVKYGKPFIQQYPVNSDNPEFTQEIDAQDLWKKIIHNAWKSAEPGILFWDNIQNESLADEYAKFGFESTSTNPCGEIPLCPYDSCRLLSLNLFNYVENPFTEKAEFKMNEFNRDVGYATRMMDNIIDLEQEKIRAILEKVERDPEDERFKRTEKELWTKILQKTEEGRRTGIGVTAEGDMIAAMNLRYGTDEATDFAEEVHKNHAISAYMESAHLAKERGTFSIYDQKLEKDNPFLNRLRKASPELSDLIDKNGRRNISLLTIAPNGTVSIMAQTTSGIEPLYLPAYKRNVKVEPRDKDTPVSFVDDEGIKWFSYNVVHQPFKKWLEVTGQDPNQLDNIENVDELVKKGLKLAKDSPYFKATSNDIDWVKKVEMQGRIQKWIDHSISSTTNMPKGTPEEVVAEAYLKAWESGCKGMTVYVDGSRGDAVLSSGNGNLEEIVLVQNNVKPDQRIQIKPQAIKYKVKRINNKDSLHFTLTSELYVDDENKKAYFIPDEDFQVRAPIGAATSVSFAQSGMDRTEILRGPDPDYAEFVKRLQSPFSNEDEGVGKNRIQSIEHAAGLVFEDYLTRNGVIGKDEHIGILINKVKKSELRKVEKDSEEYKTLVSQIRILASGEKEITINGNNGKEDSAFVCKVCGNTESRIEAGCRNPICSKCGWTDPNKDC